MRSLAPCSQAKDQLGQDSRVAPERSIVYTGGKALGSASTRIAADQQVGKAVAIADLNRELGFSAGSLRLRVAAGRITAFADLPEAADIAGIEPLALHRRFPRGTGR